MRPPSSLQRTRRIAGVGALLLALLLSQWLGWLHAVGHVPAAPQLTAGAPQILAKAIATDDTSQLLHKHSGQAACQLFDHLLMGQVPSAPPVSPPCPSAPGRGAVVPDDTSPPAAALAAYDARGPPRA